LQCLHPSNFLWSLLKDNDKTAATGFIYCEPGIAAANGKTADRVQEKSRRNTGSIQGFDASK
jgi:hypothetical protein